MPLSQRPYHGPMDRPMSDLLASLRSRDPNTLAQLVTEHARQLYRGARSIGFSEGEAEDLTQDVFVTFLETLDRFEGRAQVGTWLFGILYRKAQERRRARSITGQSLKVGRMEFLDGTEVAPKNGTLAALQRDRISARLIANFGFTHVQRSVDGAVYGLDRPATNVTILVARPTQGVFQVNGWGELNIELAYGAVTHQFGDARDARQWRLFGAEYYDGRDGVVKAENRSVAARQADHGQVRVATFGGNYLRAITREHGTVDVLVWGAVQLGAWGQLAHRASAFAAEAGWQPHTILAPWIRGGLNYGSGDGNSNDSTHGTFFPLLPTPRQYARVPFFNMMNTVDGFGELILRPTRLMTMRSDVHTLRLADAHDLWYQGGGAYQPTTFGYVGQPTSGSRHLATLVDASADVTITPRVTVTGYYGYAAGGPAFSALYPTGHHAALGYVECLVRF